jgi:Cytochrome C and Quinol oxidase polypeptide I.
MAESIAAATATPVADSVRREVVGWVAVGVIALGIAGAFAFLLAFSRIPGIERVFPWPLGFFGKGLVIHVVFSFVVWFLCIFAALAAWTRGSLGGEAGTPRLGRLGPVGAGLSLPLLFLPAFLDRGEATLNNYIPVIIDPLYYAGLALLAAAIAVAAIRLLVVFPVRQWHRTPLAAAVAAAAAIYLAALIGFAIACAGLVPATPDHAFNEYLLWGGGHILQYLNTTLAMVGWCMLATLAVPAIRPPLALALSAGALKAVAWGTLLFYAVYPTFSGSQMLAFTDAQYVLGPAAAVVALCLVIKLRAAQADWREPALRCLALSVLVFGVGGTLGLFVDGTDTRTPAHYHGVIAGVTLALIGVAYLRLLPAIGRASPSPARVAWTVGLFGWGQFAACLGLFLAGGHGAPRKVAGAAQGLSDWAAYAGMGLNGLGGLIAVIGGIIFVWTMAAALLRPTAGTGERAAAVGAENSSPVPRHPL